MSDPDSWLPVTGIGGLGLAGGVVCCVGLKLVGGAALFGGAAAVFGITADQLTFLLGGIAGLGAAFLVYWHRRGRDLFPV